MKDVSLKTLKIYYECQDSGSMNQYFESHMRALAKKYGITFHASGMDMATGIRDMAFEFKPRHGTQKQANLK